MKDNIDRPTRGSIEKLFRELRDTEVQSYGEYQGLRDKEEQLRVSLLSVPAMQRATKKAEEACAKWQEEKKVVAQAISNLHRKYLAHGLTPAIEKEIKELVKKMERVGVTNRSSRW